MDWTTDWNMDSILDSFSSFCKPGLGLGAMLGLGTTQESPQQQLADLQGNFAFNTIENAAYKLLSKKFGSRYHSSKAGPSTLHQHLSPMLGM